jgi:hypothetical protein
LSNQGDLIYVSAFAFNASNSSWGDRAGVEQLLGLRDLGSGPPAGRLARTIVERLPLSQRLLRAALPHPVMLGDQIDQHPEPGQDHDEDHPRRLGKSTDVVTAP